MRDDDNFLADLRNAAERSAHRYYSLYSTADAFVPGNNGVLYYRRTENDSFSKEYSCHGHYTPMVSPSVWKQIQTWLKED
ncbi:MAG: hypothetical protein H0X51_09430 [Parachlamydiaceae bacterium]|nr:hypothetical protein [Parachlamydiaceae bacterium]